MNRRGFFGTVAAVVFGENLFWEIEAFHKYRMDRLEAKIATYGPNGDYQSLAMWESDTDGMTGAILEIESTETPNCYACVAIDNTGDMQGAVFELYCNDEGAAWGGLKG